MNERDHRIKRKNYVDSLWQREYKDTPIIFYMHSYSAIIGLQSLILGKRFDIIELMKPSNLSVKVAKLSG